MTDLEYMMEAYKEALKAYELNEVPVGCIIVFNGEILSRAHNLRQSQKCAIYHAEILAIEEACKKLDRWILSDCVMYVTLEPCLMCSGAIIQSRIKKVIYGIEEDRFGCFENALTYFENKQNHKVIVEKGIMEKEIRDLLSNFFKDLRNSKKHGGSNV